MAEELRAMEANNTWSVVELLDKHSNGCRWIYKIKYKANGQVDKYKDCLVAKGYTLQAGIDFMDIFSPVAKITTVRVLLSLAAIRSWHLLQLNVNNAFLMVTCLRKCIWIFPLVIPNKLLPKFVN